jgi:putative hemolysin
MKKGNKIVAISLIAVVLITGIILIAVYFNKNVKPVEKNVTNNSNTEIPDPAGYICNELGYKISVRNNKEGQYGVCIFPDGTECDEWEFYGGLCGQNWSYCEKEGYDLVTKNDGKNSYSPIYAVCVDKNTKMEIGSVLELIDSNKRFSSPTINSSQTA